MQNNLIKKIFVCEFITGGGFNGSDLSPELAEQGQQMRDALLQDLSRLPYQTITTVDIRLVPPVDCDTCHVVNAKDDVWQIWGGAIQEADAVWLIAPETDGYLERMTALALEHSKVIIGCGLTAVTIFSSKLACCQLLKQTNIATLDTYLFTEWPKTANVQWIAKPEDGAGCEETVYFDAVTELERWMLLSNRVETHVIQPYIKGQAASISCVMYKGKANVLSCNKQLIDIDNNNLIYRGCIINGMRQHWEEFEMLANKVAQLLPDLAGYIGIDIIVSDAEKITVVEVNPRLTTSYVALQEATGYNPAELIIRSLTQENFAWPAIMKKEVLLEMSQHHA